MNQKQEEAFKKFIIKYTIIASIFTWLLATQIRDLLDALVDNIVEPFFSFDLNNDGKPDLLQVNNYVANIFGYKFPVGKMLLGLIKTLLAVLIIYLAINFLYKYTDLLNSIKT